MWSKSVTINIKRVYSARVTWRNLLRARALDYCTNTATAAHKHLGARRKAELWAALALHVHDWDTGWEERKSVAVWDKLQIVSISLQIMMVFVWSTWGSTLFTVSSVSSWIHKTFIQQTSVIHMVCNMAVIQERVLLRKKFLLSFIHLQ